MSKGIYNETYFKNNPDECDKPAILYCVILINKKTQERECIKIGITKGTSFNNVLKRSAGFKGFDIRIQKIVKGPLESIYHLEAWLHEYWSEYKYESNQHFGGHTELFILNDNIIKSIPDSV